MALSPIDLTSIITCNSISASKKGDITAYPTNTSCALNSKVTSHIQSETAYETAASSASASVAYIFHMPMIPPHARSPQQNGPICKGPAHDCTRGRSLL